MGFILYKSLLSTDAFAKLSSIVICVALSIDLTVPINLSFSSWITSPTAKLVKADVVLTVNTAYEVACTPSTITVDTNEGKLFVTAKPPM